MADVYEKLRERLDMFPQGFPRTASGVELEILRRLLWTMEIASFGQVVAHKPHPGSGNISGRSPFSLAIGKEKGKTFPFE